MASFSLPIPLYLIALSSAYIFVLTLSTVPFAYGAGEDKLSVYEALQQYGFPAGILPEGVIGYDLNTETGQFSAYLENTCKFPIESYELEYKSKISGVITKGRISNLSGVKVKVLFLWLSIVEVINDGDELEFSVGIASANFPLDNFLVSPQCGCGLVCEKKKLEDGVLSAY